MSKITKILSVLSVFITFLLAMSSCKPTKYLQEGDVMLKKIKVKGNKDFSTYSLEEFYRQKPNRKFLLLPFRPYLHAYYYGENIYDSVKVEKKYAKKLQKLEDKYISSKSVTNRKDSINQKKYIYKKEELVEKKHLILKEGNWLMRSVGEKIIVYDSSLIRETAVQQKKYLHSNGYFRANVQYKTKIKRSKASVTYIVNENAPYTIKKNLIVCKDKKIKSLISSSKNASLINEGEIYSDKILTRERERITNLLKSKGYFHFHRRYIHFDIDSSIQKLAVHIRTVIENPQEGEHEKYKIKNVYFTTDASIFNVEETRDTTWYKSVYYLWYKQNVSHKILERKLKIHSGDFYSYKNTIQTQKNLADLNMYKFVNINFYETEDSTKNEINCYISTSPFQKYQLLNEFGLNLFQNIPGPFGNFSFKTRNLFTGAEILDINLRAGIEGQTNIIDPEDLLSTTELGISSVLSFPKFFLPPSFLRKYHDYNPRTQLKVGVTLTNRQEFIRDNATISLAYMWQKTKNTRSIITPLEFSLINTRNESEAFRNFLQNLIDDNNPIYLSFRKSIVSSIRYDFIYDNNISKQKKRSKYFRLSLESGGTTLNFIQKDLLNEPNKILGLDYYQFLRGLADFRYYIPTKNNSILATRISIGAAKTVGTTEVLPYEKFLFSGGSYSNRAWLPRRLGPGSYTPLIPDTDEFDTDYKIEQPGELLFETNLEYRFRVKGVLDGAIFTDIGNVWTLNDDAREGSLFEATNFVRELAVGAGIGFRFDFSFLILRFDIGSKIWDPALNISDRFIPKNNSPLEMLFDKRLTILNLGIGYPF